MSGHCMRCAGCVLYVLGRQDVPFVKRLGCIISTSFELSLRLLKEQQLTAEGMLYSNALKTEQIKTPEETSMPPSTQIHTGGIGHAEAQKEYKPSERHGEVVSIPKHRKQECILPASPAVIRRRKSRLCCLPFRSKPVRRCVISTDVQTHHCLPDTFLRTLCQ